MSTEASNLNSGVSFSNDVEEQGTRNRRPSNEELRSTLKDRASLSQSAKAWDLDGDGELDEAEMALKGLDSSHKGTLNKDQMYKLMSDNLQTQRDLFKVKKLVIGLVVFACILALSNFATAIAAAFLAKDTKSEDDNLTDAKTGRTLATQTTKENFVVDREFDEQFSRQRRLACSTGKVQGVTTYNCDADSTTSVAADFGKAITKSCKNGGTVSITKTFTSGTVSHPICPVTAPGQESWTDHGGNGGNKIWGLNINRASGIISIQPDATNTEAFTITGLKSDVGSKCDATNNCVTNSECVAGTCKGSAGALCPVGSDHCIAHHSCVISMDAQSARCQCSADAACNLDEDEICAEACAIADGGPICATMPALAGGCPGEYDASLNVYCGRESEGSMWTCMSEKKEVTEVTEETP